MPYRKTYIDTRTGEEKTLDDHVRDPLHVEMRLEATPLPEPQNEAGDYEEVID